MVTPGMVLTAFRTVKPPASQLIVQPPNGRTLVNFETNFYTEQPDFTRTLSLLGQQVQLRIHAATFTWRFGDGTTQATSSPGSAYPDLEITHNYTRKGNVSPRVDTTYSAEFRVGGNGAWRNVPGTVSITGPASDLQVVEASPKLTG